MIITPQKKQGTSNTQNGKAIINLFYNFLISDTFQSDYLFSATPFWGFNL